MQKVIPISFLFLVFSSLTAHSQINESAIRRHIYVLANDSLSGRGTGSVGGEMAASYIASQFKALHLKPLGDKKTFYQAFPFKSGVHNTGKEGISKNVVGFLDNKAKTTIVIGAHYDHLGLGDEGGSLDANPTQKIHNGADDNASGTAGVLELARYFKDNKIKESNNFLFVCFSGEELGLIGSKYFTQHLPVDSSTINFMINMDMIGRLNPTTMTLIINGTGTSPEWEPALKRIKTDPITIKTDSSGLGPSDHSSFYLKGVPAVHFFTDSHSDYHKPSDDFDKINYSGEVQVLDIIIRLIQDLEPKPKLAFLTTKNKTMGGKSAFKVTMGIMPNYSSDVEGLQVDGVTDGKPAQKAGVKAGDVIIQMGDLVIKDMQNYMEALGKFEKGQTIPVKVKRGNEVVELTVTF